MTGNVFPILLAQAVTGGAGGAVGGGTVNPAAVATLAFRRWCAGLTLCSPDTVPGLKPVLILLLGLGLLLATAVLMQGPAQAFRQVFDLPGHLRLFLLALSRVWRSTRVLTASIAFTVFAWTASQCVVFLTDRFDRGKADLAVLVKTRGVFELAGEQAALAALTPLRDLAGLADHLLLLILGLYLLFRMAPRRLRSIAEFATNRDFLHGAAEDEASWSRRTQLLALGGCYTFYRLVAAALGSMDLPLGGCLVAESILIPFLMLACDGFLLAWVLTELRSASMASGGGRLDPQAALDLMPASTIACFLVLPARYLGTMVFLASYHLPTTMARSAAGKFIRWQLGWGLAEVQAVALVFLGIAGVVAWGSGSIGQAMRGFLRLLRREGGNLFAATVMSVAGVFLAAGLPYPILLLLPPAGWVLPAADSYSHYLTLPVGLWTLGAMIEIARRHLSEDVAASGQDLARRPETTAENSEAMEVPLPHGEPNPQADRSLRA